MDSKPTFSAWFLTPVVPKLLRQAINASANWFLERRFPISDSLTPVPVVGLETSSSSLKLSSLNYFDMKRSVSLVHNNY